MLVQKIDIDSAKSLEEAWEASQPKAAAVNGGADAPAIEAEHVERPPSATNGQGSRPKRAVKRKAIVNDASDSEGTQPAKRAGRGRKKKAADALAEASAEEAAWPATDDDDVAVQLPPVRTFILFKLYGKPSSPFVSLMRLAVCAAQCIENGLFDSQALLLQIKCGPNVCL